MSIDSKLLNRMQVFADVAAQFGIDSTNEEAVDDFFEKQVPSLPVKEQEKVFGKLLESM